MTSHLYGLNYSPWTERACWALDHHRVTYRYHQHVPMLGEPLLKFRARRTARLADSGDPQRRVRKATVPLFVTDGVSYADSLDIMRHADRFGSAASLNSDAPEVERWAARVEYGLNAGRALVTAAILADPAALKASARAASPAFLAGVMSPVAALGARFVARKYGAELDATEQHTRALREVLLEVREARGQRRYLFGDGLSAVDLLVATFIQGILPVDDRYIHVDAALRRAWTRDALALEFTDLTAWRDALYAAHRTPRQRKGGDAS